MIPEKLAHFAPPRQRKPFSAPTPFSASLASKICCSSPAVGLNQLAQAGAERRQVILPTVHSGAHRELRIALLYVLLEVNAHAGHGLQVFHYCSADGFTDDRAIL